MDPVTHALSGAVLARAFPVGQTFLSVPCPGPQDERMARTARWALVLGSIFPDIDVIANPFDPDNFATIRIHRSLTHSFVCLPVWACLFALLAGWYCRRRGIPAPRRVMLGMLFGVGIGLHIVFDCITSFGTMVWSPISWTRVQWDWTFIIDLTLTAVLLFFVLIAWVAESTKLRIHRNAAWMLALMGTLAGVQVLGSYALGSPVAWIPAGVAMLAAIPLLATLLGGTLPLTARSWCRLGLLATAAYLGMNAWAHQQALSLVRVYTAATHLDVIEAAAIPLPPNLTMWQGLARTPDSVHEWEISLIGPVSAPAAGSVTPAVSGEGCPPVLWTIPQVRTWLSFARFPVVVCGHTSRGEAAEFTDLRFRLPAFRWMGRVPHERPIPFTWRVTFDDGGRALAEGWVID